MVQPRNLSLWLCNTLFRVAGVQGFELQFSDPEFDRRVSTTYDDAVWCAFHRDLLSIVSCDVHPYPPIWVSPWVSNRADAMTIKGWYGNGVHSTTPPRRFMYQLKKRRLTIQCDDQWSFLTTKTNKQWGWLALDADTRLILGCWVGSRDDVGAAGLWRSLPPA
jgi:hypothetical protein